MPDTDPPERRPRSGEPAKLPYQAPRWEALGTLAELTRGSAGPYIELDEFPSQTPG